MLAWRERSWTLRHATLAKDIRLCVCVVNRSKVGRSCFGRHISSLRRRAWVVWSETVLAARAPVRGNWRIRARVLVVRILRRVSSVLSLARGLANTPAVVVFIALSVRLASVDDAVHAFVALGIAKIVIDAETRAAARTATLALVVSRKGVSASKPAATLVAGMRALAGV